MSEQSGLLSVMQARQKPSSMFHSSVLLGHPLPIGLPLAGATAVNSFLKIILASMWTSTSSSIPSIMAYLLTRYRARTVSFPPTDTRGVLTSSLEVHLVNHFLAQMDTRRSMTLGIAYPWSSCLALTYSDLDMSCAYFCFRIARAPYLTPSSLSESRMLEAWLHTACTTVVVNRSKTEC